MDAAQPYSLLLKGGHVIDPANGINGPMDVALSDERVAAVQADIPSSAAAQTIDVTGHYVTPGLIDMHVHLHPDYYFGGIVADAHSWSSGITTMVDAGSAGGASFGEFIERAISKYKTRIFAYVNIVDWGMRGPCEQETWRMKPLVAAKAVEAYPEVAVGIKTAHYWTWQPYDDEHGPWTAVDRAVEAARLCGKPLMVDFWPRPERPYAELILEKMGPGDIHTHVFAQHFPIIKEDGKVNEILFQAQERGVIFDVGHGGGSFWFRNAVPALEQGFMPNSISTDLHIGNAANGLVTNILNVMSKFVNMGVSLEKVIHLATVAPAREILHPELGTLSVGGPADVAVFNLRKGQFGFYDCGRAKLLGDKKLECMLTVQEGVVRFDPNGLSMPEWMDAPDDYWVCKSPTGAPSVWRPPRGLDGRR